MKQKDLLALCLENLLKCLGGDEQSVNLYMLTYADACV